MSPLTVVVVAVATVGAGAYAIAGVRTARAVEAGADVPLGGAHASPAVRVAARGTVVAIWPAVRLGVYLAAIAAAYEGPEPDTETSGAPVLGTPPHGTPIIDRTTEDTP